MRQALLRATVTTLRIVARSVPRPLRVRLEDRVFGAVHHLTRVTNDAYPQPTMPDREANAPPQRSPQS